MSGIKEAIQVSSAPSDVQDDLRVEAAQDLSDGTDGHAIDPPAFEQRDLALTQADSITQIALAPTEPLPQVTPDPAEPEVIRHPRIVAGGA
jgi:hypothetical protein